MSRIVTLMIHNVPVNQDFNLLSAPEVKAYAEKFGLSARITQEMALAGVRVRTKGDIDLYFPMHVDDSVYSAGGLITESFTSHQTVEFTTTRLGLPRSGHHQHFPNLFGQDVQVLWFTMGARLRVDFEDSIFRSVMPCVIDLNREAQFFGNADDLGAFQNRTPEQNQELQEIKAGKTSLDMAVKFVFAEKDDVPLPLLKKTLFVPALSTTGVEFPAYKDYSLRCVPATVQGSTVFETSSWDPVAKKRISHLATFTDETDAEMFTTIRAFMSFKKIDHAEILKLIGAAVKAG